MKKLFKLFLFAIVCCLSFSSCVVSYINTDVLKSNYETKINNTTFLGKVLFKTDVRKKDTYDNIKIYLNESEIDKPFEVTAYGSYHPYAMPIIRPERRLLEKYLLWKAARKARKLKGDGVIITNKNDFRVIKFK